VYLAPDAQREKPHIERLLRGLFDHYAEHPPPPLTAGASDEQRVVDWLAGMTDRYAIKAYVEL
jgi:dGTPase